MMIFVPITSVDSIVIVGSASYLDVSKSVSKLAFATPSSSPNVIILFEDNDSVSCAAYDEYTSPVLEWG